jgi:hypothetical protein
MYLYTSIIEITAIEIRTIRATTNHSPFGARWNSELPSQYNPRRITKFAGTKAKILMPKPKRARNTLLSLFIVYASRNAWQTVNDKTAGRLWTLSARRSASNLAD